LIKSLSLFVFYGLFDSEISYSPISARHHYAASSLIYFILFVASYKKVIFQEKKESVGIFLINRFE